MKTGEHSASRRWKIGDIVTTGRHLGEAIGAVAEIHHTQVGVLCLDGKIRWHHYTDLERARAGDSS